MTGACTPSTVFAGALATWRRHYDCCMHIEHCILGLLTLLFPRAISLRILREALTSVNNGSHILVTWVLYYSIIGSA